VTLVWVYYFWLGKRKKKRREGRRGGWIRKLRSKESHQENSDAIAYPVLKGKKKGRGEEIG